VKPKRITAAVTSAALLTVAAFTTLADAGPATAANKPAGIVSQVTVLVTVTTFADGRVTTSSEEFTPDKALLKARESLAAEKARQAAALASLEAQLEKRGK